MPDLYGVWCASRTLCWAVGGTVGGGGVATAAILMTTVVRQDAWSSQLSTEREKFCVFTCSATAAVVTLIPTEYLSLIPSTVAAIRSCLGLAEYPNASLLYRAPRVLEAGTTSSARRLSNPRRATTAWQAGTCRAAPAAAEVRPRFSSPSLPPDLCTGAY